MLMRKNKRAVEEIEKKEKKAMCDKFGDDEKKQVRKDDKEKMHKPLETSEISNRIFNNFNVKCVA